MLELIISTKVYNTILNGGYAKIEPLLSKTEFDILKSSCRKESNVFVRTIDNPNKINVYWSVLNPTNPDFSDPKKSSQFFEVGLRRCFRTSFDD